MSSHKICIFPQPKLFNAFCCSFRTIFFFLLVHSVLLFYLRGKFEPAKYVDTFILIRGEKGPDGGLARRKLAANCSVEAQSKWLNYLVFPVVFLFAGCHCCCRWPLGTEVHLHNLAGFLIFGIAFARNICINRIYTRSNQHNSPFTKNILARKSGQKSGKWESIYLAVY